MVWAKHPKVPLSMVVLVSIVPTFLVVVCCWTSIAVPPAQGDTT